MTNNNIIKNEDGKLVIYTSVKGVVELRADTDKETIWATQNQIAELFESTKQNIGLHLKNIFNTNELSQNSAVKDFFTTAKDGKQYRVNFYNLDAIIAVGYRVNSKKATNFRIWATTTLREYLIKGMVVNSDRISRLPDNILKDLDEKIAFIQETVRNRELNSTDKVKYSGKVFGIGRRNSIDAVLIQFPQDYNEEVNGITNINANSKSFNFLSKEKEIYSLSDLKKKYA